MNILSFLRLHPSTVGKGFLPTVVDTLVIWVKLTHSSPFSSPFNITEIQTYAPTSNAEEPGIEWFYEDLQDLLELTPEKDILFIIGVMQK